jgi:hypothetical protein
MNAELRVLLPSASHISSYNLAISALGYETRARYCAERFRPHAARSVALGFSECQCLSFPENATFFRQSGFEVTIVDERNFVHAVKGIVEYSASEAARSERPLNVWLDVSCFTRTRLAVLFEELLLASRGVPVRVDFLYSVAQYSPPDRDDLPLRHAGPVTDFFAGWSPALDLPPVGIVGLGYEQGRALGALERLEADDYWLLKPVSSVGEYSEALMKANEELLGFTPLARVLQYDVEDPFDIFINLESLVAGVERVARPILLPLGPKIFCLVSLIVAALHRPCAVWRVSAGEPGTPTDRVPTDSVVRLSVVRAAQTSAG